MPIVWPLLAEVLFWSCGAVAVVIWVAASRGFVVYLNNFDAYNRIYGSIGAVVALLFWLYLSGYAILLGAAVFLFMNLPDANALIRLA